MRLEARLDRRRPRVPRAARRRGFHRRPETGLAALFVCSKDSFVRMYDHEVLGQSVLKQFRAWRTTAPATRGSSARARSKRGIAVACGIAPFTPTSTAAAGWPAPLPEAVRTWWPWARPWAASPGSTTSAGPTGAERKTPDGRH
jgi:phosphoribosylformylglycinamidine synthase